MSANEIQSRMEAHNSRVQAFVDRKDLADMTVRQRSDARSEALRQSTLEMLLGYERMGLIEPSDVRRQHMKEVFRDFLFELEPASGWDFLLHELDLIFVEFDLPETRSGHADLRKEVENCLQTLNKVRETFYSFNHSIDFSVASMMSKADTNGHIPALQQMIRSLETVSQYLKENAQAPRWREKALRESRVELGIKLLSIYDREFGEPPKPNGGSANLPLEECNSWTRFFQACAFLRMGERASPDRQKILWEAYSHW